MKKVVKSSHVKTGVSVFVLLVVVVAVAILTASITGNVIKVNEDFLGRYSVFTKAEVESLVNELRDDVFCSGDVSFELNNNLPSTDVCSYSVELVTVSDTSATIKVTDKNGTSNAAEISEGSLKIINGLDVHVVSADENNLKLYARIKVKLASSITPPSNSSGGGGGAGAINRCSYLSNEIKNKVGELQSQGIKVVLTEGDKAYDENYVILLPNIDGPRLLRIAQITNQSSAFFDDRVTFVDAITGLTYTTGTPGEEGSTTLTLDGITILVKYYGASTSSQDSRYVTLNYQSMFVIDTFYCTFPWPSNSSSGGGNSSSGGGSSGGGGVIGKIIDNGESGFSTVGLWQSSNSAGYYGNNSVYSKYAGNKAMYTFSGLSGKKLVYAWWTAWNSRATNAPYKIYDGTSLLATVRVNQQSNGGKWNLLGNYTFSSTPVVVIEVENSAYSYSSDAVKMISY